MTTSTFGAPHSGPHSVKALLNSTTSAPTVADIDQDDSPSPSKSHQPLQSSSGHKVNTTLTNGQNGHRHESTLVKLINNPTSNTPPSRPSISNLVNNPTQPNQATQKPVQSTQATHHPTQNPRSHYPAEWRPNNFSPGIVRTTVAGKTRLVKRTPSKAHLFPDGDDEEDDAMDGRGARAHAQAPVKVQGQMNGNAAQTRESEEEADEVMGEETDELDLTAPVDKFDSKTELVEHWNQLQDDLWPYLKKWGETRIAEAELSVRRVYYEVHQMTTKIRDELEKGVMDIEEQEAQHQRARKMILEFQNDLKVAGARMGDFGPTSAERRSGH